MQSNRRANWFVGVCVLGCLVGAVPVFGATYTFESGEETWQNFSWDPGITNVEQSTFWAYGGTHSLRLDCNLVSDGDKGWAGVTFDPVNLQGSTITVRVYCPTNSSGSGPSWAWTQLRLWVKDSSYNYQETAWDAFTIPTGISTQTLTHTVTGGSGFDSTNVIQFGVQVYWRGYGTYQGPLYIDNAGFGAVYETEELVVHSNDVRYTFEPNKEGWVHETYVDANPANSLTGIVSVAQSTNEVIEGAHSLQMNVQINQTGTNHQKGGASVDMRWYPPPEVRAPFNLQSTTVYAYVFCPAGSESSDPGDPNLLKLAVKSSLDGTNWYSQVSAPVTMHDNEWVELTLTPNTNTPAGGFTEAGFTPTNIVGLGVLVDMSGSYNGPLYLDNICFGVRPDQLPANLTTNTQHHYDMEAASQQEWWKWATNPDGWNAHAWDTVSYSTNHGVDDSVALAANAEFVVGGDEIYRKGVFEIAYQPALNLSTKDHRKIQAKLKFEPAVEGLLTFDASINVFDKVTDQWYTKTFKVGGSGWNTLDFDLDLTNEYTAGSPVPMITEAIGFVTIQLYANNSWTGTVYLDDVVIGGRETGTNYNLIAGGYVQSAGHKFVLDGSNFYHCGANIEYLQTVADSTVRECLDWASSNHVQVVRTWAMQEGKPYSFQPERGVWNEVMFEHLDRIVAEAGHRGIHLMLDLVDNWAHNGGVFQYVHWVVKEHPETVNTNLNKEGVLYHDQFWTNTYCKQWYKDYVVRLLNRTNTITGRLYKDDPTIFAWEIVNEPRCESDFAGSTIHNWLHEMSDYVRSIDTNHLLGNGEEGGYVNTYDFADTIPWEVYPDNYYHYATYATGSSTCDLYGCGRGHGVDYLSDNKSASTYVQWQGGFFTNRDPVQAEWRSGNSNVNFCTARIYVDQKEYNVWRTNNFGADQRLEWINDHWYDSHNVIDKPMILEEFGIHAIGWIFNGSYGQVQLTRTPEYTFQDRVNIYDMYYNHIEKSGISASYFWNFGYDGMWNDPFHKCNVVDPWFADTAYGAATTVTVSQAYYKEGTNSLKLSWNYSGSGVDRAIFKCPTNEKWVLRVDSTLTNDPPTHGINRTKFFWNFYNPSASDVKVSLAIAGGLNWYWCESAPYTVTAGWNKIIFDLSAGTWAWTSNDWQQEEYLINIPNSVSNVLEDVKEVGLVVRDLPAGAGDLYIDDIQIKRDDGFVVYADDPVCAVIKEHADQMAARNVATNNPANHIPVASNGYVVVHTKDPSPVALFAGDEDGDFLSYRIITRPQHGWLFGTPPNLTYVPKVDSYEGEDYFTFIVHDGMSDSSEGIITVQRAGFESMRYDYESGTEGWYANYQTWSGYGVTSVAQTAEMAFHSNHALRVDLDLGSAAYHDAGETEVNFEYDPPAHVMTPINLQEQPVRISVFCPAGSRGSEANPNRIQLYVKDVDWLAEYTVETNIVEEQWITYTLVVSTNTPPGGWKAEGFQPNGVRSVGVRVKYGGSGSEYEGPIYVDAVRFPVQGRELYGFDSSTENWSAEDWGSGEAALSWTNGLGNPRDGVLCVTPAAGSSYGKFYIKDGSDIDNQNVMYTPIYQVYIYVPADASTNIHHAVQVSLLLRSSSDGWSYDYKSEATTLTPGEWNLVTWDMSALPAEILMDADEFGLEIVWPNRDVWSGPVYVDSIGLVATTPSSAPQIESITPSTNTVGRYQKYEVTVGLGSVSGLNPYNPENVDLKGVFVSPSGTVWTINGFYMEAPGVDYGSGEWKIRFAPNEIGTWQYTVSVANDQGSVVSATQSFACVASDEHGWIRVSDDDHHYFEFDDDTPFIGRGYCHPWDADDEGLFKACEDHGINMIHWWMAPWDTMLTVKPANPDDWWREKSTYDTYEQGRAAEIDRTVGHAEKYGVKMVFTIWPHDAIRDFNHHKWRLNGSWAQCNKNNSLGMTNKLSEPEWYYNAFSDLDDLPRNQKFFYDSVYKAYQDRLYRYIIARWGYSEAIGTWALASELFGTFANSANSVAYQNPPAGIEEPGDFDGLDPYENMATNQVDGNDYTIPWLSYINGYFKTNDPFGHPTTASYATDEYWENGFPIVDVPQIHDYADIYSWITPPVTLAKYHHFLREEYDKPAFMGEIGTVEWKLFEPDYARVATWPAVCSGAAITPMMWTTPAFSMFGDAKMGPWYEDMSDEMKVLSEFFSDVSFHKLGLTPADVQTTLSNEPLTTMVEDFEGGLNNWETWGPAVASYAIVTQYVSEGSQCLRLDIDMDTYDNMPDGPSGIQKYEEDGFAYNWSNYWPNGTIRMDVYIPEFYNPDSNTNGFLLGINKDPRSIVEVFTKDEGDNWHWYSTTNEYGGDGRESGGWKKLTVGMRWNLELPLGSIPTAYEAAHITGLKFHFGDVGILRGPIYIDNITAGLYAYNTYGLVSSNKDFAFAWIQDRKWSDTTASTDAVFVINGLNPGIYNLEWWSTRSGIVASYNVEDAKGDLHVQVPEFNKDIAVKIRRVGNVGATVHDVAVASLREYSSVVRSSVQPVYVQVINQGTESETFDVVFADETSGQTIGTNTVTLAAGYLRLVRFLWNNLEGPLDVAHTLTATIAPVSGETDTADNTRTGHIKVCESTPPWDSCDALKRWAANPYDTDGRTLTVSTNYASEGGDSFAFYHRSPEKYQAYFGFDNVYEDWSNRTALMLDVYVADTSTNLQLLMRTGPDWTWYFSEPVAITSGWNYGVTFHFDTDTWTRAEWNSGTQQNDYYYDVFPGGMDQMQQIFIKVTGYTDEGTLYFDNITLDGLYTLHLAMVDGVDFFPRAKAAQSNFTGVACAWMIARFLNGESWDQTQQQIYDATTHDPAHNNEVTPASCANWMAANIVDGYNFDDRYQTNVFQALRETIYWMDYVPAGGLQTPVYLVCGTNYSYKVVRGFQSNKKPYDSGAWGSWMDENNYTVYGMWLNDPTMDGLGYNVYATAGEMTNIFLASTAGGQYWFVAEPPEDSEAMTEAVQTIEGSSLALEPAAPNTSMASFLASKFGGGMRKLMGAEEDPELWASIPMALRNDPAFMQAYNAGQVMYYYAVNTNRETVYYLAAGGVRGPGSTTFVLKLAPDGSLQQATWSDGPVFYQPLPLQTAEWAARRQFIEKADVELVGNELVAPAGGSPFTPQWNLQFQVDGTNVNSIVRADVDLSGDADGDGMSDGEELYAGLDPNNQLSVFSIEGGDVQTLGDDRIVIHWDSTEGRTYSIYRSTNLLNGFSVIASRIAATPAMNTYTDQVPSQTVFYRIEVE